MRVLLVMLMLLVSFNVVLVPIVIAHSALSAETTSVVTKSSPSLILIDGTIEANFQRVDDPGSGGGGQGTI